MLFERLQTKQKLYSNYGLTQPFSFLISSNTCHQMEQASSGARMKAHTKAHSMKGHTIPPWYCKTIQTAQGLNQQVPLLFEPWTSFLQLPFLCVFWYPPKIVNTFRQNWHAKCFSTALSLWLEFTLSAFKNPLLHASAFKYSKKH